VFLNLPAMGADPNHKDVFVHVDFMVAPDHSHRPKALAMQGAIDAFAAAPVMNPDRTTGITLHIDCGPDCVMNPRTGEKWGVLSQSSKLDHVDALGTQVASGAEYRFDAFDQIKNAHFPSERAPAFHYVVFAHDIAIFNADGTVAKQGGIA